MGTFILLLGCIASGVLTVATLLYAVMGLINLSSSDNNEEK